MAVILNRNTHIEGVAADAVRRAASALYRDMRKVFLSNEEEGASICLVEEAMEAEQFFLKAADGKLELHAGDELGFIYGIYEISRNFLGVNDFWFWNDQQFVLKKEQKIPGDFFLASKPCAVKYRGWFINDEVLLHTWHVERKKDLPWEMAFEALLRCGGNMVIPGTDRNAERYRELAASMGLYITHHHAEPLGAEMFARAYPKLNPSYAEYPELFRGLWMDALEAQKGMKVVWNLGFRGQGDCPFWVTDPLYETDEARGKLLSSLIRIQYDLVKKADPQAPCCTNLYGEMMELYQKGCLELPEDVIKIWADNGYGKMVSRRQNNHNPRVPALPEAGNREHNGIYYHISFYDLQAANHITMLPNPPSFVVRELSQVLERNGKDFWIINCSNIKPHVYFLDLVARLWREGTAEEVAHRRKYAERYYGEENADAVVQSLAAFHNHAVSFGEHEDERAGEQFFNHVPRMLVSQLMKDKGTCCDGMRWAAPGESLREQTEWYERLCTEAAEGYEEYVRLCEGRALELKESGRVLFEDSVLLQAKILYHCCLGASAAAQGILAALAEDYKKSFYLAGRARKEFLQADSAMRAREHGKWHGFYENECLTDIKQTAWMLENMMGFVRNLGEGPHFYKWQREFLYPEEDRRIMLILNMENHLNNSELFALMEAMEEETNAVYEVKERIIGK